MSCIDEFKRATSSGRQSDRRQFAAEATAVRSRNRRQPAGSKAGRRRDYRRRPLIASLYESTSEPVGTRTRDLRIKSPLLYRLSYRLDPRRGKGLGERCRNCFLRRLRTAFRHVVECRLIGTTGIEPARVAPLEPKSSASANSATSPQMAGLGGPDGTAQV